MAPNYQILLKRTVKLILGQFKGVWGLPEREIGQFWAKVVEIQAKSLISVELWVLKCQNYIPKGCK